MLKYFRRHARSWIVKLLYAGVIVVFALWGVGINLGGEQRVVVATVNDHEITRKEVENAYQRLIGDYRRVIQGSFSPEMLAGLGQQALDQLIDRALLRREADRLGIDVTDEDMREAFLDIPGVRNAEGTVQPEVLAALLRQTGLSPAEFEELVLVNKLQDVLTDTVPVTEEEAWQQFVLEREQVSLWQVQVPVSEFEDTVTPSDEDVRAYYEVHAEDFREPDRATIEVLRYEPATFAPEVVVSAADIEELYALERDTRFMKPERTRVRHIFFRHPPDADAEARSAVRTRAEEVLATLREGGDFAALAAEHSEDPESATDGGDLGWIEGRSERGTAFDVAMLTLEPGELSDLVESTAGIHIVRVEEREPAHARPLEEVRGEIEEALRSEKAAGLARKTADADRRRALAGTSLAALASERGVPRLTPPALARGETIPTLPDAPQLVNASFALEPEEVSPVFDLEEGPVFFRLTAHTEGQVPELSQIREKVEREVRKEKAAEAAEAAADALRRAAETTDLAAAAKNTGRDAVATEAFARTAPSVPGIGPAEDLKMAAFALRPEAPLAGPFEVGDSFVVVALKDRQSPDREQFATEREPLEDALRSRKRQAILRRHLQLLKSRAQIVTYPEKLAGIPGV